MLTGIKLKAGTSRFPTHGFKLFGVPSFKIPKISTPMFSAGRYLSTYQLLYINFKGLWIRPLSFFALAFVVAFAFCIVSTYIICPLSFFVCPCFCCYLPPPPHCIVLG